MARLTQAEQLARYRRELARSKKWRQAEGYDDLWSRMVDLYAGKHYSAASTEDRLVVNMVFATKNVIAPSIAVNNPKFIVYARKPEQDAQAVIAEEVLNYLWRTNDYHDEFRRAVDDFLVVGHGWLKVGYKFVKEDVVVNPDPSREGVDDRDETAQGNLESESRVIEDRPFVERVPFRDVFVDPDGRSLREAAWIAQRVRRPISDVRVDKRYEPSVRKAVQPNRVDRWGDDDNAYTDRSELEPTGFVDVIEFWDLKRNVMCVFAETGDGFLIKPKRSPYAFGHPFVMLRNYEVPDRFYPMGEIEAIEALQLELNETRTQMLNHRKKFARKWLYNEAAFDERGVAALESDDDNVMVPVIGNEPLSNSVVPMPAAITPPDFYNQSNMIEEDINTVTGVSDYMRGQMPNIRRTATEAAMLQDAQNARAADKLAHVESFLAQLGRKLLMVVQQFMTGEQVFRVVGPTGMRAWVVYTADHIAGEFDFEVEAGSTQPRNESFRRQSALQLVDAMAPFAAAGVVNMAALAQHVLKEGFGVKGVEAFMAAPPQMIPGAPPQQVAPPPMPAPAPPPGGGAQLFADVASAQQSEIPPEILAQLQSQMGMELGNIPI